MPFSSAHPLLVDLHKAAKDFSYDKKLNDYPEAKAIFSAKPEVQREVLMSALSVTKPQAYFSGGAMMARGQLISRLISRKNEFEASQLIDFLKWSSETPWCNDAGYVLKAVGRFLETNELTDALEKQLKAYGKTIGSGYRPPSEKTKFTRQIAELIGGNDAPVINVDNKEPWVAKMLADLEAFDAEHKQAMLMLISAVSSVSGSKPSAKWSKEAAKLCEVLPTEFVSASLSEWLGVIDQPRAEEPKGMYGQPGSVWTVADCNADLAKGFIWLSPQIADKGLIRAVATAGLSGQRKIPGVGPRSSKVTNAAMWALGQIDDPFAIGQLAIMRAKIKNKAVQKVIDNAMQAIADRIGVTPEEVEEMSVPTYGLTGVGQAREQLGEFTAELTVTGTSSTELKWIKPDGKPQKSVPKAVKDGFADEFNELKAAAKDIQKMLPAQRDRLDRLFLDQKTWAYTTWAERYLDHPLVGILARRLIWIFDHGEDKPRIEATWLDGQLVDAAGKPAQINEDSAIVSIWHPIGHSEAQIKEWRVFFEGREIRQPFKQAHREVYLLTDAERNTGTYSNRYASHIIKQHQYNALCATRGWRNALRLMVDDEVPSTSRAMRAYQLRAEFWVEGVGEDYGTDTNEAGTYLYLATDQVRFYRIDAAENWGHAYGGGFTMNAEGAGTDNINEPIPLDQIDPLVLSEVMRDVDLFVGVASVGNDPNWQDGGPEGRYRDYWHDYSFGDLGATAQTRKEILSRLVPRLKIAERCSFDDKFLVVRGDKRTYKIHLGSSNILMEPNDQYLCIVPGRSHTKVGDKVFLPFEGDQRLAIILSKAMMLADDNKINDPTILSQIGF